MSYIVNYSKSLCVIAFIFLGGCSVNAPEGMKAVSDFKVERYIGKWYEVARLDNRFERGLTLVSAEYAINEDGSVSVLNRGFDAEENEWKSAKGRAYFVEDETTGFLKVSFFGPFYGAYVIFELDKENYQYALVSGENREYFWLLSRTPSLPVETVEKLMHVASSNGFDTNEFLWVEQRDASDDSDS